MFNSRKRRGPYVGSSESPTPLRSTTSDTISVLGRRPAPSTAAEARRTPLMPPKRMRLTKMQLAALQRQDSARDKALMNEREFSTRFMCLRAPFAYLRSEGMTLEERSQLANLQQDIVGKGIYSELVDVDSAAAIEDGNEGPLDGSSDNEDEAAWEDENVLLEGFGMAPKGSEWCERLMGEHDAWLAQLPVLCDAYLAFRAGVPAPVCDQLEYEPHHLSLHCINIDGNDIFVR
jgi:hypothetical protein